MASAKQIAWRKKFAKLYGKKKKGSKSKKSGYTPATLSQYDSHAQVKGKKKTGSNRVFKRLEKLKNGGK